MRPDDNDEMQVAELKLGRSGDSLVFVIADNPPLFMSPAMALEIAEGLRRVALDIIARQLLESEQRAKLN